MFGKESYIYHCTLAQMNLQAVLSVSTENFPCLSRSFCSAAPAYSSKRTILQSNDCWGIFVLVSPANILQQEG